MNKEVGGGKMVSIREINYLDAAFFPKRSNPISETVLVIKKSKGISNRPRILCYLLNCSSVKEKIVNHSSDQFLEIIFDINCPSRNDRQEFIPLQATKEMEQQTCLLFDYYSDGTRPYSVEEVIKRLTKDLLKENQKTLQYKDRFMNLLVYMNENSHKSLTIEDLCNEIHVSRTALNRLCKEKTGASPMKLFRKIQCDEARRLLINSDLSIEEISDQLGFKKRTHFTKIFKNIEGITPKEVRKQNYLEVST